MASTPADAYSRAMATGSKSSPPSPVFERQELRTIYDELPDTPDGLQAYLAENRPLVGDAELGLEVRSFQSNSEGALIDALHEARQSAAGVVFNPGAYTHTSVALRDAIAGIELPVIEVHLSNVFAREPFRHRSYLSDIAIGVISGLGAQGYELALAAALRRLADGTAEATP